MARPLHSSPADTVAYHGEVRTDVRQLKGVDMRGTVVCALTALLTAATLSGAAASGSSGSLHVSASIHVGKHAAGVAVAGASVWVTNDVDNTVSRIDPGSNTVTTTVKLGGGPYPTPDHALSAAGALWVLASTTGAVPTKGAVTRIDPDTGEVVATTRVPGQAEGLANAAGALWLTSFDYFSWLTRIDLGSNMVSDKFSMNRPTGIAAGYGYLWVVNHRQFAVSAVDPHNGHVVKKIDIALGSEKSIYEGPERVATGFDSVWVSHPAQDTVTRIAAGTKRIRARIVFPRSSFPFEFAAGAGSLWVLGPKQIFRVDPRTNRIVDSLRIGRHTGSDYRGLRGIAVDGQTLWITDGDVDVVDRIDVTG
jgi:YVTN family beta-propeller protein